MNEERREYLISNNEPDPMEEFLVCEENEAKMERVLDILPKKYHEITNLKYIGYKNREIRKKLNIDDKKLRSKIVSIKKFVENYY
jgi:DNA-directed RNA polymerase specialized sigma24 family protein